MSLSLQLRICDRLSHTHVPNDRDGLMAQARAVYLPSDWSREGRAEITPWRWNAAHALEPMAACALQQCCGGIIRTSAVDGVGIRSNPVLELYAIIRLHTSGAWAS